MNSFQFLINTENTVSLTFVRVASLRAAQRNGATSGAHAGDEVVAGAERVTGKWCLWMWYPGDCSSQLRVRERLCDKARLQGQRGGGPHGTALLG